jgi:hypothetical protein
MYNFEVRQYRPEGKGECVGLNYISEFMLFLVFDKWGKRRIVTIPLTEEVEEIVHR